MVLTYQHFWQADSLVSGDFVKQSGITRSATISWQLKSYIYMRILVQSGLDFIKIVQTFKSLIKLFHIKGLSASCCVASLERFQGPKRWMCSTKLLMIIYYVKTQIFEKRIFFCTTPQPGLGRPGLKRLKRPIYLLLMNGLSKFLFSMKTIMR